MKILAVDDILSNRMFLSDLVESMGFTCVTKESGQDAVDYLTNNAVDAIILDIEMPNMNGLEAATYIKDVLKIKTPIASFTSHDSEEYTMKMKNAGFDYLIYKKAEMKDNLKLFLIEISKN